jgi:L-ascorbate metabolism protein UlaG (beta-lactamase superfamily)
MVKITWLGHAAFKIEIANRTVLIDPWLDGNPTSPIKASEITKADVVYVTHDHHDHLGDAFNICRKTGATFAAVVDLAGYAEENGIENIVGFNIGGTVEIKGVKLVMTQATHTASRGTPTGVIIEGEGKTVYHAGDTGLFSEMSFIGELHKLDVALIPMGGYYTMEAREAVEAVRLLKPRVVIPMHYKTFPVLAQSADEFARNVREKMPKVKVVVLNPGESYEF